MTELFSCSMKNSNIQGMHQGMQHKKLEMIKHPYMQDTGSSILGHYYLQSLILPLAVNDFGARESAGRMLAFYQIGSWHFIWPLESYQK